MPWNTDYPDGSISVKANESIGQENTTYTKTTMNVDHYWDTGANEDGHHKRVEMTKESSDPSISAGMDGVVYLKDTTEGRTEGFYRNSNGIYQYIPSFKSGSLSITSTSSYVTVTSVPANVYGQIFIYHNDKDEIQVATFISSGTTVNTFSSLVKIQGNTSSRPRLIEFGNGSDASGLNIRARRTDGTSGTWNYRVIYREI